jgi:peptide deformylase
MSRLIGKAKQRKRKQERMERERYHNRIVKALLGKIRTFDDPILKQVSEPIELASGLPQDAHTAIKEMTKVLGAAETGLGLAAVQVGVLKRICIYRESKGGPIFTLINPTVIVKDDRQISEYEGCLSFPKFYKRIKRPYSIEVTYKDNNLNTIVKELTGMTARIVLHEMEHMDGKCLVGDAYRTKYGEKK